MCCVQLPCSGGRSFPVSIIDQVARILQTALGRSLDDLGRQTDVIKRQRKFSGATLLKTIVLTLLKSPNAKPDQFVTTAAQLGVVITPQAMEKRFSPRLVAFLRASLEHPPEQSVSPPPAMIPLLERFTAVEVGDSSTITLPEESAEEFPGCGGTPPSGKPAVKIQ